LLAACDIVTPAPPLGSVGSPSAPPEPTSTPAPELLAHALERRALGDYDQAADELHSLLTAHPDAREARPAAFYLAESFALRRRWTSAVEALRGFVSSGSQDDLYARALFLLARGQEQAGAWADAVATYERYRALKTVLEPYARLREAAQLRALGRLREAAEGYEAVAAGDITRGERAGAYEKSIALREQLGQNDVALQLYPKLLALADAPDYRARILGEAATLAQQLGASDTAYAWWREIAEKMPEAPQALDAITQLQSDPRGALAPESAAHIYVAHEQWADALPQFDAAIIAASGEAALDLRRQQALARRATDDFAGALAELAAVAAESPSSEAGRQAQLDWVQTQGQSGDIQAAITGYRAFADAYPADSRAPEALSRAATLLTRLSDAEGAAQQQLDLGRRYPASDQAHDALYAAGWFFFHAGRMPDAQAAWTLLSQGATGVSAAQGAFWAARAAQQSGQNDAARALLERAIAAAPDSYYAARAAEQLGAADAGSAQLGAPVPAAAWRAAEDWIASWSGAPAYYLAERGYPPEVAQAGAVVRAVALQDVGMQPEAIAEWNEARTAWHDDPLKLYLLARLADEHGVPYIALNAAADLTMRSPAKGSANAPEALRRLIFPAPYAQPVLAEAHTRGLDPRALYALLRQESLFNPGATSWAGALGLAQIMPSTAQGIAQNLELDGFQEDDLYRPALSIRFGAFYLGHQIGAMNGSLPAGLAAYNGGPGNAQRWAGGTTVADADLFTEGIDYDETRGYVKLVYSYYGAYRRLYTAP
jgi:soluble lytic murein transglycosylase